jgi:methionyl-tRNA formyltransferase
VKTVLLLGLGPTARTALDSLSVRFRVAGLVRDSGSAPGADEVVDLAHSLGVSVFADTGLVGVDQAIDKTSPDCVVVSSYDRILPARVLARSRFVNVHYAPLPQYRGRANVNWAIINGEPETAITLHVMAPGLDAGNILYQQRVPIGPDDTVGDLYDRLNEIQRQVLGDTVARHVAGYEGEPQAESRATYGCTRVPDDGQIDWAAPTQHIYALVRALAPPYPGAHTYLEGRRLGVVRAAPLQDAPRYVGRVAGRVVGRSSRAGHVDVLTGDGILRIHELAEDGVVGPAAGFVESTRQTLGLRTVDLLARIEVLEGRLRKVTGVALQPETG